MFLNYCSSSIGFYAITQNSTELNSLFCLNFILHLNVVCLRTLIMLPQMEKPMSLVKCMSCAN